MTSYPVIRNASLTLLAAIGTLALVLVGFMAVMHFGMMGSTGSLSDMFTACAHMMAAPR